MKKGISVVVPVYNVEEYLEQALDSLEKQTEPNLELVLVDDGSKDRSGEMLDNFKKISRRDVKVIHKKNEGLGATYNLGIQNSSCEYIGFLEPDDFAEIDMFEQLLSLAYKFDADVVKGDFYNYKNGVDNPSNVLRNVPKFLEPISVKTTSEILITPHASIWSAIYKKDFLEKNSIGFLNTPGASYQDISFSFKAIALANPIVFINKPLLHYRLDNMNASSFDESKTFASVAEFDELKAFLKKHPDIEKLGFIPLVVNMYGNYSHAIKDRVSKQMQKEFVSFFRNEFKQLHDNHVLTEQFYSKVTSEKFQLLLNDPDEYIKQYAKYK